MEPNRTQREPVGVTKPEPERRGAIVHDPVPLKMNRKQASLDDDDRWTTMQQHRRIRYGDFFWKSHPHQILASHSGTQKQVHKQKPGPQSDIGSDSSALLGQPFGRKSPEFPTTEELADVI